MGEVCHATETQLHRDVALKILPDRCLAIASPGQAASGLECLQHTGRRKRHVIEPFAR